MRLHLLAAVAALFACTADADAIVIRSPQRFQVFQRTGTTANIPISGAVIGGLGNAYPGAPFTIEARFNGGSWATIASGVPHEFSGTLTAQAQGVGALEVRIAGMLATNIVDRVGIGDVFACMGQSNMVGQATNLQSYSQSNGVNAALFGNDYSWHDLRDPYDSSMNQLDPVSSDGGLEHGSWVTPLATSILARTGVPVAFIPCAKGATQIISWLPGTNHQDRSTLYGDCVYRINAAGGKVRAVLWDQGESDVQSGPTDPALYGSRLTTIANAVYTDVGASLMPAKLQPLAGFALIEAALNAEIVSLWGTGHIVAGPDFSACTDDGIHFASDADVACAATAAYNAMLTAFGW